MPALPLIKINSNGPAVEIWQDFLIGRDLLDEPSDGIFGSDTLAATVAFQTEEGLHPDGVVGNKTYGAAMMLGFNGVNDDRTGIEGANFPAKPGFPPLVNNAARQAIFGTFTFAASPQAGDPEHIKITNSWAHDNIIMVPIPQLQGVNGQTQIQFHKLGKDQLIKLWSDWAAANLLHLILRYDGSYNPRFVRGSKTTLSNHAFGSAFDINAQWNAFGAQPALVGQKGSVRELVEIANSNGFYWGGHFTKQDGMHFEIAELL
ncbi:M15 family metallopeptidase [Mucilaginibacter agri]|uniref:Peptidoglycan-binding protein n=1 Tax=Mucilaginibacter agri TaxID=2695265 RepID=A0A965ZC08_9SPHI|nr:M15 family metallopeptidase [Mucilaginibacter agri]NCD67925.1 peptidoglycan-binding protein [Mucilaginibacter agri]